MKKYLFFLVLIVPFITFSNDVVFNRLNKLNEKDQRKCLEVSKRYMNWFPDNASPHYFASIIYQERSETSRTKQGEYRNLKKAIGYAVSFEERDEKDLKSQVNWDVFRKKLREQSSQLIMELRDINETVYSNQLLATLEKFEENIEITMIEEGNEIYEIAERLDTKSTGDFDASKEFFGMPLGTEIVPSANPSGEQEILRLVNIERTSKGLAPLEWDEDLARACRYHAYDLATQNYFNHDSYDRRNGKLVKVGDTFDRIRTFYGKSSLTSENIAAGNASPGATYDQWYDSPDHYDNMMSKGSTKVGIGVYYDEDSPFGYYWAFCTAL